MIPRIIHQIWIQGCDMIPDTFRTYAEVWKKKKGFRYYCWSDESILLLIQESFEPEMATEIRRAYLTFDLPQHRSDLGRYIVLYVHGGIYMDMDFEAGEKDLDTLIDKNKIITADGGRRHPITLYFIKTLPQCFIGSVPQHPMFLDLIQHVRGVYKKRWTDWMNVLYIERTTGGMMYNHFLQKYKEDVFIIPAVDVFICKSIHDCTICPSQVALSHYSGSWNRLLYVYRWILYYKFVLILLFFFFLFFFLYVYSSKEMSR